MACARGALFGAKMVKMVSAYLPFPKLNIQRKGYEQTFVRGSVVDNLTRVSDPVRYIYSGNVPIVP